MKDRNEYKSCTLTVPLERVLDFPEIPIFLMRDLRRLDFPITRQVSYERTVDEFLLQLASNDALRPLRDRKEMVILLNREGALALREGTWYLFFTPNQSEKRDVDEQKDDLYTVYSDLMDRAQRGEVCCVAVPNRNLKALVGGRMPFCILDEYCKVQDGGYLAVARNIVLKGPEELFRNVPVCQYGELSTVDLSEIERYHTIKSLMDDYIYAYDQSVENKRLRPISIAVFGPPGAGKSFGVKQIALSRNRFNINSINLSQYSGAAELFRALHKMLNYDDGRIPLIFFDEFDSEHNGVPRGWLKYFLAPMQDGEYTFEERTHTINGAIFVFAGATAASFSEFLPGEDAELTREFQAVKGPDFVSRLMGILNIKGPNPTSVSDRRHTIRRALLLRNQIVQSGKQFYNPETGEVAISYSLLSALLRVSEFRHGARSMELILGMSRLAEMTRFTPSCLPLSEQLDIHLDVQDFKQKLSFEQVMGEMVEQYAYIAHEKSRRRHVEAAKRRGLPGEVRRRMLMDESFAPWQQLKEMYKESYRSQIRYLGERFENYGAGVGLRPILPGAGDTIDDLYGPVLEHLAELEHERWNRDKLVDGWVWGKKRDVELKFHPEMVPYGELDESVKEFIRNSIRNIPGYLKEIGYELYRKSL